MKLSKNQLATLLYYNSLLAQWQCFVCLRDNDNKDYSLEEIFNSRNTPYECKLIYVRSYFHSSILNSFRTFVKFINTFRLLHSLHRFQIENSPSFSNTPIYGSKALQGSFDDCGENNISVQSLN